MQAPRRTHLPGTEMNAETGEIIPLLTLSLSATFALALSRTHTHPLCLRKKGQRVLLLNAASALPPTNHTQQQNTAATIVPWVRTHCGGELPTTPPGPLLAAYYR
jgi:hypothetical protein